MEQQKVTINELVKRLTDEMLRIGYSKQTMQRCVYCILKIPTIAEGNPESCMRNFPIIADAFGISLSPQQIL